MRDPLSTRSIAAKVGVSQTAIARWRRGDLRLGAETEAAVLRAEADEQARVEDEQRALRLGRSMQMELQQVS